MEEQYETNINGKYENVVLGLYCWLCFFKGHELHQGPKNTYSHLIPNLVPEKDTATIKLSKMFGKTRYLANSLKKSKI